MKKYMLLSIVFLMSSYCSEKKFTFLQSVNVLRKTFLKEITAASESEFLTEKERSRYRESFPIVAACNQVKILQLFTRAINQEGLPGAPRVFILRDQGKKATSFSEENFSESFKIYDLIENKDLNRNFRFIQDGKGKKRR